MRSIAVAALVAFSMLATGCETFEDARPAGAEKPSAEPPAATPADTDKTENGKSPDWPALVPREKWKCEGFELVAFQFTGAVTIGGHTERTAFRFEGIERRWDWCLASDGSYDCAVVVSPDGRGRYYNFRGTDGSAKASDWFDCRKG